MVWRQADGLEKSDFSKVVLNKSPRRAPLVETRELDAAEKLEGVFLGRGGLGFRNADGALLEGRRALYLGVRAVRSPHNGWPPSDLSEAQKERKTASGYRVNTAPSAPWLAQESICRAGNSKAPDRRCRRDFQRWEE
jgi:hypothetical protein